MWEDSSKDAILAMSNIGIGLGDITDASKKAGEEVNNSLSKQFATSIRKLKDSLLPLGQALLPILDDVPNTNAIAPNLAILETTSGSNLDITFEIFPVPSVTSSKIGNNA